MARIKYMGVADEAILEKGETCGGRLADGFKSRVVFNKDNSWIVDSAEAGLSDDEVAALLEADPDRFKDVTDLKRVPSNLHQTTFLGHKKTQEADTVPQDTEGEVQPGGSQVSDGDTTVGGSTAGEAPRASTRRGGATT